MATRILIQSTDLEEGLQDHLAEDLGEFVEEVEVPLTIPVLPWVDEEGKCLSIWLHWYDKQNT